MPHCAEVGRAPRARRIAGSATSRSASVTCLGILLTILSPLPLSAALTPSGLTGVVTVGGEPTAGVTVAVISPSVLQPRTTTTLPTGRYFLEALPPGTYEITFSAPGAQTLVRSVVVQLGRVARADAQLERSEDEETVTSTAMPRDVTRTTAVTTHFSGPEFRRLPVVVTPSALAAIAPGSQHYVEVDDASFTGGDLLGEDLLDEVTVFRAAVPLTIPDTDSGVIAARTRPAPNRLSVSIRDTVSGTGWTSNESPNQSAVRRGIRHLFEWSAGAPVGERLRLFAAGWTGDSADRSLSDLRGVLLKADWAPAASHSVRGSFLDAQTASRTAPPGASLLSLQYTAIPVAGLTAAVTASTSSEGVLYSGAPGLPPSFFTEGQDAFTASLSWFIPAAGDHAVTAGAGTRHWWSGERHGTLRRDTVFFFVSDRWTWGRMVADIGVRSSSRQSEPDIISSDDGSRTVPRLAVTVDVTGNGRHAIAATHGAFDRDLSLDGDGTRVWVTSLGYAIAFGSSGTARADVMRRSAGGRTFFELQAEGRYRFLDRYEVGAAVTQTDDEASLPDWVIGDDAHAWVGVELPVGDQTVDATLLQHFRSPDGGERARSTAVALRHARRIGSIRGSIGVDFMGLLRENVSQPRAARLWVRLQR